MLFSKHLSARKITVTEKKLIQLAGKNLSNGTFAVIFKLIGSK